jgi:signal transduction histidine kinase
VKRTRTGRATRTLADTGVVAAACVLTLALSLLPAAGLRLYPQMSTGLTLISAVCGALGLPASASAVALGCSLVSCALLRWRRRFPVAICLGVLALCAVSASGVAAAIALFNVAAVCPGRTAAQTGALAVGLVPVFAFVHPSGASSAPATVIIAIMMVACAVGWGLFARGLHERALRAGEQAAIRAEQAQQRVREDIAREMHDVLAHRLSLLSLHAGALEFNPGASSGEVEQAASVIRESARQALEDLQEVLTVLRTAPRDAEEAEPPQPTLRELERLLEESRTAGMRIEVDQRLRAWETMPPTVGRTAYRIVQEKLTNARKHAGGAPVQVTVHGAPGDGLTLTVTNPLPPGVPAAALPGGGHGLSGLAERAALAGGRLEYGRTADTHKVSAWLPWPT